MLSEQHACEISECVVHPNEDEDGKRHDEHVLGCRISPVVLESQHIEQGKRKANVDLAEHGISPIVERIVLLQVEFSDHEIDEYSQIDGEDARLYGVNAVVEEAKEKNGAA